MKLILLIFFCSSSYFCFHTTRANERAKRQLGGYRFPGPRSESGSEQEYSRASSRLVKREPQYEERPEYRSSSSTGSDRYRSQASQPSSYGSSQSYGYPPNNKKDQYDSEPTREEKEEKEEERKPSRLELLLAESKFTCGSKKDGYYADLSVGCQVFHYCVAGVKHSWQCPEQTVFHQVHLNCVPASQDICSQSEKFFVVNDYLHKEMDQRGPNNTIRYHQRFYPEEFLGDSALNAPQSWPPQAAPAARQTYPSRPSASQPYSDQEDDGYPSTPRGSSQPSYQSYPSQSYPAPREPEPAPYRATSRPTSPPAQSYSRQPESSYPAPATYSRPSSSYSSPSSSSSNYPSSNPRPATRYSSAPASYSAPSSSYTSSPASAWNSPSSSYSSGSSSGSSGYQPLSSRASSAIPSSYQPLSSPPAATYSRPVPSPYKKVAVTALPRSYGSYPGYNSLASSKPYGSSPSYGSSVGIGSSGRSMTSSLFAPDVIGLKSGVTYESEF